MAYHLTKTDDWEKAVKEAFEKSDDPNIVWKYEVKRSEIHLDKLEKNIKDLQSQIDNAPKMIEWKEGLTSEQQAQINDYNAAVPDMTLQQEEKAKLEKIKITVEKL